MHLDGRRLPRDTRLVRDVCIVGAGAAGITLARELGRRGIEVALLESGGFDLESETQELYAGPASGEILDRNRAAYLKASRLRFLGGSTNHWSGYCRPLDPIDFEQRPWVASSGWPFRRESLDTYYPRAAEILEVPAFAPAADVSPPRPEILPRDSGLETAIFQMSPPTRLGQVHRAELVGSHRISLVTHANVLSLETDRDGARVASARASTLEGNRFEVAAKAFVLATGGVENARLLLLSDSVQKRGLGNQNDLVGRCFMDHPHVTAGWLVLPELPARFEELFRTPVGEYLGLRFTDEEQRRHGLLNATFWFFPGLIGKGRKPPLLEEIGALAERDRRGEREATSSTKAERHVVTFEIICEQAPSRSSRVTLADERDALGQRRAQLEWRLGEPDVASLLASCERLGLAFGRSGLGRAGHRQPINRLWASAKGGAHHIGTTRMHPESTQGVVDADARVHGVANLWVAGSSIFPTSGSSNPTLTIVALTFRLADRLLAVLPALGGPERESKA